MKYDPNSWAKIGYLNSENPDAWGPSLYKLLKYVSGINTSHTNAVAFIKVLKNNWSKTIPELLTELEPYEIDLDIFFELERTVTFKLASLLGDINSLQEKILDNKHNISQFVSRISHAFLPPVVYQLEEFGLPRMISRKIQKSGVINLEKSDLTLKGVIELFNAIGAERLKESVGELDEFDKYIIDFFYSGIEVA